MKKLLSTLCLAASVFACASANAQWEYSFVLGASGGYNWSDAEINYSSFNTQTGATSLATYSHDNDRWGWGILGGFQAKCHRLLLGLEVSADWLNDDDDNNYFLVTDAAGIPVSSLVINHDNDAVVAFTARVGYDITPWLMAYIRAGAETFENDFNYSNVTTAGNFVSAASSDHRTWGFVGGVGAEIPVPVLPGLAFRTEWNYHAHDNDNTASALLSNNINIDTVRVNRDHTNTLKASLVYNFPV